MPPPMRLDYICMGEGVSPGRKSMSSFRKIVAVTPSVASVDDPSSASLWKRFKTTKSNKEIDSVSAVKFDMRGREVFCTAASRLVGYSVPAMEKIKSVSKSTDGINCIDFRCDGKLFALGTSSGNIQVFDAASKKIIRRLNGHSGPVRKLLFSPDKTRLVSVSDDKTFRVWDIAAESELASVVAHSDYVRTCALSHNGRILVTGSYDCTIKVWNLEDLTLIHTLNNNHPVEDVLISPNASVVISAGANILSFWDISIDGKLLHSMSPHQKTITSIAYTADCSHIITGGLDRHAKIVDLSSYRVIHSFKLASPVMCVACNSTDSAVAFGLANGHSVVKMRKLPSAVSPDVLPEIEFNFVASRQQFKFSRVERAFKAFRFRDALDSCLEEGNPRLTLSCCTELLAYDALAIALSGRDEHTLLPILKFISKTIQDPEFCHISMEVFASVIDIYGGNVGQSAKVDAQFRAISHKMKSEINVASMLSKMHGQLGMICSSSSRSVF